MKTTVVASLVLAAAAGAHAATPDSTSWSGRAFVRTDTLERVVIVLDADRDGSADHVFLFDPLEKLPLGLSARETDVHVTLASDAVRLRSTDGLLDLTLRAHNPPQDEPASLQSGGLVRSYGRALVHRVLGAQSGTIGSLDTNAMPTVFEPKGNPRDEPCLNPTSCRAGGKGSTACAVDCGGKQASLAGFGLGYSNPGCNVACNLSAAVYACCNCDASGGTCGCYSSAPCVLDPKPAPVTPEPK